MSDYLNIMDHLRYANMSFQHQRNALFEIVLGDALIAEALRNARDLAMPNWRLVSGAIYNTIWNALTNRPSGYGIKDVDLFYFDDSDLSYDAEDRWIKRGQSIFAGFSHSLEIKNQARVHLWFKNRFGSEYPKLTSTEEGIDYFASRTYAVGLRIDDKDVLDLYAPYGLNDMFSFRITPNYLLPNKSTYDAKRKRVQKFWPEIQCLPW